MRTKARQIIDLAYSMKPGQMLWISGRLFQEAFPVSELSQFFDHGSPIDQFLEQIIGSMYGSWRCRFDPQRGDYLITCHGEDPDYRIYHVSPDRRDLFRQLPDGTYERR